MKRKAVDTKTFRPRKSFRLQTESVSDMLLFTWKVYHPNYIYSTGWMVTSVFLKHTEYLTHKYGIFTNKFYFKIIKSRHHNIYSLYPKHHRRIKTALWSSSLSSNTYDAPKVSSKWKWGPIIYHHENIYQRPKYRNVQLYDAEKCREKERETKDTHTHFNDKNNHNCESSYENVADMK